MEKPTLGNPKETIKILQKYGFHFQKKYGQNFLIDPHVLEKIVRASEITSQDVVLEIGPGIGTLTQYLGYYAGKVFAVEIDRKLEPILQETLAGYDNVEVLYGDVLKLDLQQLLQRKLRQGMRGKVVANLPYYITTPIVMGLLESELPIESIVVMVQEEVARRMQALPGTKEYGALSLAVQYYAKPYIAAYVPPNCFLPRPRVGSAVIRLTHHTSFPVQVKDQALLFAVIRAAFQQRRKTLVNALKQGAGITASPQEIVVAVEALGKGKNVRGEALCLSEFAALANALTKI